MNRTDSLSGRVDLAFLIFMGVLAFLGKDNPDLDYPQILHLFVLLAAVNLAASAGLRRWPRNPVLAAVFILADCATITAIQAYSGGASSLLWVLYFLPIFTVCLLLGARETVWVTVGVVAFNSVFVLSESQGRLGTAVFEMLLKSGLFAFTSLLAWRLASRERDARSRLQDASQKAERLAERLESAAALSEVGLVGAGVAHDLRNTFMVIHGFAETVLQDASCGPDAQSGVERIRKMAKLGGDMAQHLVRHGADARLELADDDLGAIASGMAGLVKSAFLSKGALLEAPPCEQPCPIRASRVHLQRLLMNLLLNALSVSEAGRRVRLTVRREGAEAVAAVEDEGPGFSPGIAARLFGAYETTRAAEGGTGLGLNLCARIAREHGGGLSAENRLEGGARLVLRLPLAPSGKT